MSLLKEAKKILNEIQADSRKIDFYLKNDWEHYKNTHPSFEDENKIFIVLDYDE